VSHPAANAPVANYGPKGLILSAKGTHNDQTLCVQEIIVEKEHVWDMSKVEKEKIGKVHACTLLKAKSWSNLNGEKFCGRVIGEDTQPNGASKCKSMNAKLPQPRTKSALRKFTATFSYAAQSGYQSFWLDMTDIMKTGTASDLE